MNSHQLIHDRTHVIRRRSAWPGIRVIREDLEDGNLGRYKQPSLAVVAFINERNKSPGLCNGQDN